VQLVDCACEQVLADRRNAGEKALSHS
jgi:hypothetical protein